MFFLLPLSLFYPISTSVKPCDFSKRQATKNVMKVTYSQLNLFSFDTLEWVNFLNLFLTSSSTVLLCGCLCLGFLAFVMWRERRRKSWQKRLCSMKENCQHCELRCWKQHIFLLNFKTISVSPKFKKLFFKLFKNLHCLFLP